jgi:hypothetical protein
MFQRNTIEYFGDSWEIWLNCFILNKATEGLLVQKYSIWRDFILSERKLFQLQKDLSTITERKIVVSIQPVSVKQVALFWKYCRRVRLHYINVQFLYFLSLYSHRRESFLCNVPRFSLHIYEWTKVRNILWEFQFKNIAPAMNSESMWDLPD